jgi:hypothetical protein
VNNFTKAKREARWQFFDLENQAKKVAALLSMSGFFLKYTKKKISVRRKQFFGLSASIQKQRCHIFGHE